MEVLLVAVAIVAELTMEGIVGHGDASNLMEILVQLGHAPSTVKVVVHFKDEPRPDIAGQLGKIGEELLRDNSRVAILTAVDVQGRLVVVRQANEVEDFCVRDKVAHAILEDFWLVTSKANVL